MAKKRSSVLGFFLKTLIVIVVIIVLLVAAFLLYFKIAHNISIIGLIRQVKTLSKEVDVEALAPNAFNNNDFELLLDKLDNSGLDFLYYEDENGNVVIDTDAASGGAGLMTNDLSLTDKQLTSFIDGVIESVLGSGDILDMEVSGDMIKLYQIEFSEFEQITTNTARIKMNVVFSFDLTLLKKEFTNFPLSIINRYIPEKIYVNSTTLLETTSAYYGYNVTSHSISVNNLTTTDTLSLFETINKLFSLGSIDELNKSIGEMFADTIIGNQLEPNGIAYLLRGCGATGFSFINDNGNILFVITKV